MKIVDLIKNNKVLLIILFVAACLRFYKIDFQSVWLDEIHTLNEANPLKSFIQVYDSLLISEPHPPLYFFTIHLAFKIFGYTTLVARFLSAIIGVVGIFSIYLLGKELYNNKVGIYAVILLTVNYFHLYYSQEARMYSLLFLTTTLSFVYLIKFIKKPDNKSAGLYVLFSLLMIYSHFFALFTLLSQYLILLYFVIKPFQISRKKFVIYCFISGVVTLLLFMPTYKLILRTTEMTSIWIQMPTLDVFTQFFKDFFGQSELVIFFILSLVLYFFIKLFSVRNSDRLSINPLDDKLVFSFFILFLWILFTLFFPLVRTYTSLPMLVNRYFINILPAVLIIASIGLFFIKNYVVRYTITAIIVLFSLTDIIIVKKYYNQPNKTQFREVSDFIKKNNSSKEPIITSLSWYFPYFLNNDSIKSTISEYTLDNYVNEISKDSTKIKSFWYVDGHIRPYKVSDQTQAFLNEKFSIEDNIDLYDCWARHYVVNTGISQNLDISKFKNLQTYNGDTFISNIEKFEIINNKVNVHGFAFFEGQLAVKSKFDVLLIKDNIAFKLRTMKVNRPDVTTYFKSSYDVNNSGFNSSLDIASLAPGKYMVAIYIINKDANKEGLFLSDKVVEK